MNENETMIITENDLMNATWERHDNWTDDNERSPEGDDNQSLYKMASAVIGGVEVRLTVTEEDGDELEIDSDAEIEEGVDAHQVIRMAFEKQHNEKLGDLDAIYERYDKEQNEHYADMWMEDMKEAISYNLKEMEKNVTPEIIKDHGWPMPTLGESFSDYFDRVGDDSMMPTFEMPKSDACKHGEDLLFYGLNDRDDECLHRNLLEFGGSTINFDEVFYDHTKWNGVFFEIDEEGRAMLDARSTISVKEV